MILAPARKAQEVSPDRFTGTGVNNVNQASQQKAAVPALKHMPPAPQAWSHQTDAPAMPLCLCSPAPRRSRKKRKAAGGATRKNNRKIPAAVAVA